MQNLFVGNIEIKAWDFPKDNEVDIEIWRDDNYVTTLTINTLTGAIVSQSIKEF